MNIGNLSTEEREKILLKCFTNGLHNRDLSSTMKLLKPKTLDEAIELIKNEKQVDEEISLIHNGEMEVLLKRIKYLENNIGIFALVSIDDEKYNLYEDTGLLFMQWAK